MFADKREGNKIIIFTKGKWLYIIYFYTYKGKIMINESITLKRELGLTFKS